MDDWTAISELLRGRRVGRGRAGVAAEGDCWIFQGATDPCGYGRLNRSGHHESAHRYIYAHFVGEIPAGACVLHACDRPACVRPSHLWIGTQADNIADMIAKGRAVPPPNTPWTHCKNGHELTEDNIYREPKNPHKRRCLTCLRQKSREWSAARTLARKRHSEQRDIVPNEEVQR